MTKLDSSKFYSQERINLHVEKLKRERRRWLKGFEGLNPAIVNEVKL
jgi:hypothetical protein